VVVLRGEGSRIGEDDAHDAYTSPPLPLLVRSWNVFHGRAHPPDRQAHLEEAIRLVTADTPDVVCLQEVPVWGLSHLSDWSGMQAFTAVTRRAPLGARIGRYITDAHHGLIRSAVSGQGNAILVSRALPAESIGALPISEPEIEPRVCHGVRLARGVVVANLHLSWIGSPVTDAEIARALSWLDTLVGPDEPLVLAGDFNTRPELPGFSEPGLGIDHVLVRGAPTAGLEVWPTERRRFAGRLLSDHAPVEAVVLGGREG
jgi:endonuclease/exonuclease/phosphatase family metal-dependent hydrolase